MSVFVRRISRGEDILLTLANDSNVFSLVGEYCLNKIRHFWLMICV